MPTDIGVIYENNTESRIHRFIENYRLEGMLASLPASMRHKLATRRNPHFPRAIRFSSEGDGNYNLKPAEDANCIFVHVPKTAGVSLAKSLFGNYAGGHIPVFYYLWLYGSRRFDSMFKFSFVRHPETRLISAFNFLHQGGMTPFDAEWSQKWLRNCKTVDDFVQNVLPISEVKTALHFRKQSFYLTDPRTGKTGLDFIGRQESFQSDFESLCIRLGVQRKMMKINTSSPVNATQGLSPESRKLVRDIYAEDYDTLDY